MDLSAEMPVELTFTAGEWSVIMFGLDELPRKQAQPIWGKINSALVKAALPVAEVQEDSGEKEPPGKKK